MKSNTIIESIQKGLLVIGILLMLSAWALAGNNEEDNKIVSGVVANATSENSKALSPPGAPADPTGSITVSGTCGNKTLTRTHSPPPGDVWYWQTSYNGTSVTYSASTYSAPSTGTYYIKAYKPSSQQWSNGYLSSGSVTVTQTPSTPGVSQESNKTTSSFRANWSSVSGASSYRLDVATNSSFTSMVSGYNNKTVSGTNHTVSGLTGGQYYYYRLRAYNNGCTSGNSGTITANTTLSTPSASQESNQTTSSFRANWGAVSGTNSYRLDVSTNTGFTTFVSGYNNKAVVGTNQTVSGLNAGATYYYRVRAYSSPYTSGNSSTITANTTIGTPTASEESNKATTSFRANWTSVSGATSYKLYVSTSSGFGSHISGYNGKSVGGTNHTVTGLSPGTQYYYRLKAVSSVYTSGYSNSITANTTLSTPTASQGSNQGTTSFRANWGAVSGTNSYRLDVATNSSFTAMVSGYNNKTVSGTNHTVTGISPGTYYYYRVRAYTSVYTSGNSSTITTNTILDTPTASQESNQGTSSFRANWGAVSGTNSYRLDVSTNTGFTTYVSGYNNRAVVGNYEDVTGLNPAATYYYRIRAYSSPYTTGNSSTITATTTLSTPTAYEETGNASTTFQANWSSVSGAAAYRLDVSTDSNFTAILSGYNNLVVSGTNHVVTGLSPGTNYYYRVRAYSSVYTSGNSGTITANTILSTPTAQQPSCATTSSFTATWGSITGATEYLLYVSTASDFSSHVSGYNGLSVTSGTSKDVTSLSAGVYYYRLKAKNSVYTTGYSNTITVTVPGLYNVTGGVHCSTSGTLTVGLDGSQSGMEYQLYYNYAVVLVEGTSTPVKVFGTGSAVNFTYDAEDVGTYEVYAVNGSCSTLMTGTAKIINPPTEYTITTTAYCANSSGALIIDDTNLDAKYQVKKDGVNEGNEITGTGSGMTLGNYDDPGVYTVVATYAGSNCSPVTMAGSITVETVVPMPNAPNITTEECYRRLATKNGAEPGAGVHGYPISWYWFDDDENNLSPVLLDSHYVYQPDIYYVKAKGEMPSAITCWSAAVSIDATDLIPGPIPEVPDADSISVSSACGPQPAVTIQNLDAGQQFYWQGLSNTSKLETDSGTTSDNMSLDSTYYVRTKTDEGCWSVAVPFEVDVTLYPLQKSLTYQGDEYADDPANYRRISVASSEQAVNYKVYKSGQLINNEFSGTGQTVTSNVLIDEGSYTVIADREGCTTNVTGTAIVGSDSDMNYSASRSFTIPETDTASLPTTLGEVLTSTSYADGMGRPLQSIAMRVSPDQKDLISFYEYDDLGRLAKQYLPYVGDTTGTLKTGTTSAQASFYLASGDHIANDSIPYSLTTYEASPMNRVKNQLGVGQAWHDADRKTSATYATNATADSVIIWQVVSDTLAKTGTYTTGQLYKTTGTDEENHKVITYTNKVGQTVLKQVESGATTWAETYNVYDYKGRLRYVLPPGGVEAYESSGQMTQSLLDTWAFQYHYDHRHRLIEKRVPGADWVYLVYDDRNRLVLTQDGNQRADTLWSFVKYDQLNRTILTGQKVITDTITDLRVTVDTSRVFYETYDSLGLMKYTNLAYPTGITANDIHTVSYYDSYDFTDKTFSLPTHAFTDTTDYREIPAQTTHALKGLATGAKTKVLETTTFLETVNFYDDKYRVVQSISENHKGGGDTTTVQYNFAGQVMKTHVKHNPQGIAGDTTTIEQAYTYDHVGRSLTTTHSIDGATAVTIASYTYNELGALENKTLADGFEDIDYEYNIRGWITQMNNPNDSEDHLFEMEFKYETATDTIYNGNIGEVAWKSPYESTTSSFDYTYDEMNRLKTADYDNTGTSNRDYGLESISYDANGNIKTLKRKGDHDDIANQSFDDLVYSYSGNKLIKVTDNASMDTGFKDGANVATEYLYDANGNLTEDKNKGITAITYNHINQPTRVTYDSTKFITYTYAASGAKVSQMVVENGDSTVTDYLGGFLYQDDTLQIIAHSQGRIIAPLPGGAGGGYEYQYHLTDHLGNVRVTFKTEIDTDEYLATLETDSASLERPYFYNLDSTRYTHTLANNTAFGDEVSRIGQDSLHLIGPAIALKVVPGDTINMEVYAYYEGGSGYNSTVTLTTFINALAGTFGGSSGAGGESGAIFDGVNDALVSGNGIIRDGTGDNNVPAAYLSYILFDQNYEEIQTGYHEISSSADLAKERLFLDDITVSEPGYLYIYTSVESKANLPVYFDDLKVAHRHSPVVQKSDYQAFGMEFNSYSRSAVTAQNFKFNAGSELEKMTDWYSTPFRKYDPSLGRFHGVDKLADMYSGITPSHFAMNNPINYNDPTGLNTAPKNDELRMGSGTTNRHTPDGLGPNNRNSYGRNGSLFWDGWTAGIYEHDWDAHNGSALWRRKKAAAGKTGYYNNKDKTWYRADGSRVETDIYGKVIVRNPIRLWSKYGGREVSRKKWLKLSGEEDTGQMADLYYSGGWETVGYELVVQEPLGWPLSEQLNLRFNESFMNLFGNRFIEKFSNGKLNQEFINNIEGYIRENGDQPFVDDPSKVEYPRNSPYLQSTNIILRGYYVYLPEGTGFDNVQEPRYRANLFIDQGGATGSPWFTIDLSTTGGDINVILFYQVVDIN